MTDNPSGTTQTVVVGPSRLLALLPIRFLLMIAGPLIAVGCATMPPTASAPCRRRHLVIEPRLTVSLGLSGEITPVAAVTVRPACRHVEAAS